MVADISNKLHLTSGATTSLLNQLEEESLIQRVRDEKRPESRVGFIDR